MKPTPAAPRQSDAQRLVDDLIVAHAAAMARLGRYDEAEGLIQPLVEAEPARAEILDLIARIRVRQGRVDDALNLWRQAIEKDGTNSKYRAAVEVLARNRHPARRRLSWAIGLALGTVLLLSGIGALVGRRATNTARTYRAARTGAKPPLLLRPGHFSSKYTVSDMQGESVKIGFTLPLFAHDARLTANGKRAIADLSARLKPFAQSGQITIVGKTDGIPVRKAGRYSDNSVLGMLRAIAVYNELRGHLSNLTAPRVAADPASPSMPGNKQLQLRTVIVLLTVAAKKN